jgi:hypothetical protein
MVFAGTPSALSHLYYRMYFGGIDLINAQVQRNQNVRDGIKMPS